MPELGKSIKATVVFTIIAGSAIGIILAGILGNSKMLINESFENKVLDWQIGKDLPIDPNTHLPVYASVQTTNIRSRTGEFSLLLQIDGRQDDGTIWIAKNITLGGAKFGKIEMAFYVFSEQASFNVKANVVAYVGPCPPLNESYFEVLGNADRKTGWTEFIVEKNIFFKNTDYAWIALGITVAWETILEYTIDDITVRLLW